MFGWLKRNSQQPQAAAAAAAPLLEAADRAREAGDTATAQAHYLAALGRDPGNGYAHYWLATLLQSAGDLKAAREHAERALALDPDQIGLLLRLGSIAMQGSDPMGALTCYERIFALDPAAPGIDQLLANQYTFLGRIDDAVVALDRALAREPDSLQLQSNRLFVLNYASVLTPEEVYAAHREWGLRQEEKLAGSRQVHAPERDPERKLRIGYVSPDLREHAVAFFVAPLLRHHDRERFDITCYDTSPFNEDGYSARLRQDSNTWRRVGTTEDDALAALIRTDRIDILVDLTGHLQYHRLLAFARRPAPVQATWLGYLNTTGLDCVDYRITDDYLDPEGTSEHLHSETLFRLPNHACFEPAPGAPPVGPLPALREGRVTFGSVNQWSKVPPPVRDAWARILRALPQARLLVLARGGQNTRFRDWLTGEFTSRGVDAGQILVEPTRTLGEFLQVFARVDVALDPFPYGGGTTTLHGLWMGVPCISLAGSTAFSRNAIGPLTEVGLADLVTPGVDAYVDAALALAGDVPRLQGIRDTLRARMAASPLTDGVAYARHLEAAYRAMWRNFCEGTKARTRTR